MKKQKFQKINLWNQWSKKFQNLPGRVFWRLLKNVKKWRKSKIKIFQTIRFDVECPIYHLGNRNVPGRPWWQTGVISMKRWLLSIKINTAINLKVYMFINIIFKLPDFIQKRIPRWVTLWNRMGELKIPNSNFLFILQIEKFQENYRKI